MGMKSVLAITAAVLLAPVTATAQSGGYGYQLDPQVEGAFYEVINTTTYYCQLGDQVACNSVNYYQQLANRMIQSGAACQGGDNRSCGDYQQAYGQLEQGYYQLQQQVAQIQAQQGGGFNGGYNDGLTHQQRMQQIQDFGAANTAQWQQQQQQNDANHQAFINSIWE